MQRHRRLVPLIALLTALASFPASVSVAQRRDSEMELERLQREIRRLRGRLQAVRSEARSLQTDLQAIDLELAIVGREVEAAEQVERELDGQRLEIAERVLRINDDIGRHRRYLSSRLGTLYRMGRVPYLRLLLSIDPRSDPMEGATMLAYLVGRDARAVSSFRMAQERLVIEEGHLADKEQEISRTRRLAAERRASAQGKRREKARVLAALQSESRRSAEQLAELEEKARRLERLFALLYEQNAPGISVARIGEFKGALEWPVRGEVVEAFGKQRSTRFNTYVVNNGIRIAAEPGTGVRAVFAGTVLFAQWFRGYGNLIIVDHGDRVFSLYGNTRGSALAPGDRVEAGQSIAMVAEDEEAQTGSLYFEIREDNRPTDPREWLR